MSENEIVIPSLREEVAALRAEVVALREQVGSIGIRLGPRKETPAEEADRASRMAQVLTEAVTKAAPPPPDRSKLCTTDGRSPDAARESSKW